MGILNATRPFAICMSLVPGVIHAQQYQLTPEDISPRHEYDFDLPSRSQLTNPPGMDVYRPLAEEIGRHSAEKTMQAMKRLGKDIEGQDPDKSPAEELADAPGHAELPEGIRASILVSRAMGEGALTDLLDRYRLRKDVRFVFRGVPADMTVPTFAHWLSEIAAIDGQPLNDLNIILDPELFSLTGAKLVPTVVLEDLNRIPEGEGAKNLDLGKIIATAEGYTDPDWLFEQHKKGQSDHTNPNVVEIEEEDLRLRAEREATRVLSGLTRDPEVLKQRFWDRTGHNLHMMMIQPAPADRKRQLHFMFRTAEAIKDDQGNILAHAGEVFQPNDVVPFDRRIIVFNPNNAAEIDFVEEAMKQRRDGVNRTLLITTELPETGPAVEPWSGIQELVTRFGTQVFLLNDQFRENFQIEYSPTEIYPEMIAGTVEVMSEEVALR